MGEESSKSVKKVMSPVMWRRCLEENKGGYVKCYSQN